MRCGKINSTNCIESGGNFIKAEGEAKTKEIEVEVEVEVEVEATFFADWDSLVK